MIFLKKSSVFAFHLKLLHEVRDFMMPLKILNFLRLLNFNYFVTVVFFGGGIFLNPGSKPNSMPLLGPFLRGRNKF